MLRNEIYFESFDKTVKVYFAMEAVFAIGSNGSGQLGIGHGEDVSVPKQAIFLPDPPSSPIVKVVAGGNHTLLLARSSELYWSGDATSGACGLISEPVTPVFREARVFKTGEEERRIALVAATWQASIVVARDDDGRCTRTYTLGVGTKGELGSGELIVRTPSATRLHSFPPAGRQIVDLSACMEHVVAVLDNGDAYGWGNGRKGQLGAPEAVVHAPRKIHGIPFRVVRAVCAKEATCFLGEPDSGMIQILGSDKWNLSSGAPATAPPWADVGASWGNFYILARDGGLQAWGRDDHGQLPPPSLPKVVKLAVGSEHVVALSEDGDALAWGWGEHGNCGPQVDDNNVKGRWNVIASSKFIPPGCKIDNIGAGCATSWICIQPS